MLDKLKGKLIVSCQALEEEPLHGSDIMAKMAYACVLGGASGIRCNSVNDIKAIKNTVNVPIIGIIKQDYSDSDIYITPTKKEVQDLIETKCDIIALDATLRKRPNDEKLEDLLKMIHDNHLIAMADVSTIEEAINAEKIGFDLVSTTLSGYTPYSPKQIGPDLKLLKKCVKSLNIPVIAEGRINDTYDLKKVLKLNPFAVVIGGAITRPQNITKRFVECFK